MPPEGRSIARLATNLAQRRAALEKSLRYFPDDASTQFIARANLAHIDYLEDNLTRAIDSFENILRTRRDSADDASLAWAEYIYGLSLHENEQDAEALKIFRTIARRKSISPFRRAWSAHQWALLCLEDAPDDTIKIAP